MGTTDLQKEDEGDLEKKQKLRSFDLREMVRVTVVTATPGVLHAPPATGLDEVVTVIFSVL